MKLESYGLIGDTRGSALVGVDGSIDWLCMPRFDSDASCCALLGTKENGYWQIAPTEGGWESAQRYWGDTLILETEFKTPQGRVRLVDFMPMGGPYEVIRVVEGVEGRVEMKSVLSMRFDYGRCPPFLRKRQ